MKRSLQLAIVLLTFVALPATASSTPGTDGPCSARPAKHCGCGSIQVSICRFDRHGGVKSKCVQPDRIDADDFLPATFFPDDDQDGWGDGNATGFLTCDEPLGCVPDGTDCDDDDPDVNPGMPEACNLIDDNCDGAVDDLGTTTCGLGECANTVDNCVGGVPQICDPLLGSSPEVCDLLDNDCDGDSDESLGTLTCGLGVCANSVDACVCGVDQVCDPFEGSSTEICDGIDNDCDGATDENLGATTCGRGECANTVTNCVGGLPVVCDPFLGQIAEVRDGLDNDCDGFVDDIGGGQILPGDGRGNGPALSYTDNGDGTATDNNTGLMWEKKIAGGGFPCLDDIDIHGDVTKCNWDDANGPWLDLVNNRCNGDTTIDCTVGGDSDCGGDGPCGFAGYRDWRLPNIRELQSIHDYGRNNPAIDPVFGDTPSSLYWSVTEYNPRTTDAWWVNSNGGGVLPDSKLLENGVRAVRSAP